MATHRQIATFEAPFLLCVAFSPDGKRLATGSWDATARLWDIRRRAEVATLAGRGGPILALSFSPDGKTLAVGAVKAVHLWNLAAGQEAAMLAAGHGAMNISVAFSPDGRTLAAGSRTGSQEGAVRLWRAATFAETDAPSGK